MRLVVADTSPIFYLLSVGQIELLPRLFKKVFVPDAVHQELCHPAAPTVLREWIAELPPGLEVIPVDLIDDAALRPASGGFERDAIAQQIHCPGGQPNPHRDEQPGQSRAGGNT